jgi:hypothetical protein
LSIARRNNASAWGGSGARVASANRINAST